MQQYTQEQIDAYIQLREYKDKLMRGRMVALADMSIGDYFLWGNKTCRIEAMDVPSAYMKLSNITSDRREETIELDTVSDFRAKFPVVTERDIDACLEINKPLLELPAPSLLDGLEDAVAEYLRAERNY